MDDEERNMGSHDPYAQEKFSDIEPDFVHHDEEKPSSDGRGSAEGRDSARNTAKAGLNDREKAAAKDIVGGAAKDIASKGLGGTARGLFREGMGGFKGKSGGKAKKISAGLVIAMFVMIIPLALVLTSVPAFLIRSIDLGMQDTAGITSREAIMKEQAKYIDQESLESGEVPKSHADELAKHGIEVGQVALSGEFVRTNVYLAELEQDLGEVAGSGDDYRINGEKGELSVKYKDKIVKGSDFVAAMDSDPEMYGAYLDASTVFTAFMFSDAVSEMLGKEFGITRETFAGWQRTGDKEKDQESYEELLYKAVDKSSNAYISGVQDGGSDDEPSMSAEGSSESIISQVSSIMTGDRSTEKAAQALNVAVSSTMPFKAASLFASHEEVLQRTILYGGNKTPNMVAGNFATVGSTGQNGGYASVAPIDQFLSLIGERVETKYRDAVTSEEKTIWTSVMDDDNFKAATSGGGFNIQEAQNFIRDNVLLSTWTSDREIINSATAATNGQKKTSVVLEVGGGDAADEAVLYNAKDPVSMAFSLEASDTTKGIMGSNLFMGGGPFLFRKISRKYLGEMSSNQPTLVKYNRDTSEIIARQAEAERAIRSPFDINSRYTFLGNIMNNVATSILVNRKSISGDATTTSLLGTIANLADKSTKSIAGIVMADGPKDGYASIIGTNCDTVNSVLDLEGDLLCNDYGTMVLDYMRNKQEDWDNDSDLTDRAKKHFTLIGEGRNVTPGVQDGEICEIYKKEFLSEDETMGEGVWRSLTDLLSKAAGLYESCKDVDPSESLGGSESLSEQNKNYIATKKAAGYALYDQTKSIMYGTKSEMATIRDEYYAKNPLDESPEGRLARISGLTKEEAKLAIGYANYLTMIAKYNPSERYAFGAKRVDVPVDMKFIDDEDIDSSVYLAWFSRIEYSDVRNRNFVV